VSNLSSKHFLLSYLEEAEKDSTKDYLLSMTSQSSYTGFFQNENNREYLKERLATLETVELKRSPLFEAMHLFGNWKIQKDYKKGLESAQKFDEMAKASYERNWFWLLVYCLETMVHIYKVLGYNDQLELISRRINNHLEQKKDAFPTHTVLELARLFNTILANSERSDIEKIYKVLIDFSEKKLRDDPFHFQRSFMFEAIEIARFLKLDDDLKKLQEKILQTWIDEAELKGKASNLVKFAILQSALDYSVNIGNKEKTELIKKVLSATDFSGELKEITLPEKDVKDFQDAMKDHFERIRKVIQKHVNGLTKLTPTEIILNVSNDNSIIRLNVEETKEFVNKLMREHPIQSIFGTILDTGEKTIRLETQEDKDKSELNRQLMFGLSETMWIIDQIFRELNDRNLVSTSSIAHFLSQCKCVDANAFGIASVGVRHHFQKDYVASISILLPLIENIVFAYLSSIGADVSSYQGKVIEQRELGGLLNLEEFKKAVGEDFQYFLKLLLTEADSVNLRNRFAHGNMKSIEFNESVSSLILFIILKVCAKTFDSKK